MANYSTNIGPGELRRRMNHLVVINPLLAAPRVHISDCDVIMGADGTERPDASRTVPPVEAEMSLETLNEVFPMRDPDTDELTGDTMTGHDFRRIVYSWVRAQQHKRDAAIGD